jgi:hypothetical protein
MTPATLNWDATLVGDNPDSQVATTIELMSRYVRQDAHSPEVMAEAAKAAPPGTDPLYGVFRHVKGLIRFQHDEKTAAPLQSRIAAAGYDYPIVEVLIRPRDMVTWARDTGMGQIGDCDDYAMLTAALLKAHGVNANFVTVAADPYNPGQYSHVYVAAYPSPGERVAMDTSHGAYPGWEARGDNVTRMEEWPVDAGLRGLLVAGLIVVALIMGAIQKKRRMS